MVKVLIISRIEHGTNGLKIEFKRFLGIFLKFITVVIVNSFNVIYKNEQPSVGIASRNRGK